MIEILHIFLLLVVAFITFSQWVVALRKREDDLFELRYALYLEALPVFCIDLYDNRAQFFRDETDRFIQMVNLSAKFRLLYGSTFSDTLYANLPKIPPRNPDPAIQLEFDNSMKKMYQRAEYEVHFDKYLNVEKPWYELFFSYKPDKPKKK